MGDVRLWKTRGNGGGAALKGANIYRLSGKFRHLGGKRLALRPGLRNDPIFRGGLSMGNPKVAIVAYCLAVGFILVVAFHSSSKTLITADVPAVTTIADR